MTFRRIGGRSLLRIPKIKPDGDLTLDWNDALTSGLTAAMLFSNRGASLLKVDGISPRDATAPNGFSSVVHPTGGHGIDFVAASTQYVDLGNPGLFLSTTGGTYCMIRRRKSTAVSNTGFGCIAPATGDRFGGHIPYSGSMYLDFGTNTLIGSWANTAGEVEHIVITAGVGGMAIWRDGAVVASNTVNATRTNGASNLLLNGGNSSSLGGGTGYADNQEFYQFLVYNRKLEIHEIQAWFDDPWRIARPVDRGGLRLVSTTVPPESHTGAGSLTATPVLSATATTRRFGSRSLNQTQTTAGTGTTTRFGAGTLSAVPTPSGSGTTRHFGSASLSQSQILSGTTTTTRFGSGTLAVAPVLSGTGDAIELVSRSGTLSAPPVLSVQATTVRSGAVSASQDQTLAVSTTTARSGSSALTAAPAVSATGSTFRFGVGALAVDPALSVAGSKTEDESYSQTGTLTGTAALIGSTATTRFGSGAVVVAPVLSGTAETTELVSGSATLAHTPTLTLGTISTERFASVGLDNPVSLSTSGTTERLAAAAAGAEAALTATVTAVRILSVTLDTTPTLSVTSAIKPAGTVRHVPYAEDASTVTGTTTFGNKVPLTWTPLANRSYALLWTASASVNSTTPQARMRLSSGATLWNEYNLVLKDSTDILPFMGLAEGPVASANPVPVTHTVQVGSSNTTAVSSAYGAIAAIELTGNDRFVSNLNGGTAHQTSSTTVATVPISTTLSPMTASPYLFVVSAEGTAAGAPMTWRLTVDGAVISGGSIHLSADGQWYPIGGITSELLTAADHTITVEFLSGTGTLVQMRNPRLLVLRLADHFGAAQTAVDRPATTRNVTTPTERLALPATGVAPGSWLTLFSGQPAHSAQNTSGLMRFAENGSNLLSFDFSQEGRVGNETRTELGVHGLFKRVYADSSGGTDRTWSIYHWVEGGNNTHSHLNVIALPLDVLYEVVETYVRFGSISATPSLTLDVTSLRSGDGAATLTPGLVGSATTVRSAAVFLVPDTDMPTIGWDVTTERSSSAVVADVVVTSAAGTGADVIVASGDLSVSPVLAVSGTTARFGDGLTDAAPSLVIPSVLTERLSTVSVVHVAAVSGTGTATETISQSTSLETSPVLDAIVATTRLASGTSNPTPSLDVSGATTRPGSGTIATGAALSASGSTVRLTSPSLTASPRLTVVGSIAGSTPYTSAVLADTPVLYYRLGENAGPAASNLGSVEGSGSYQGTVTYGITSGLTTDSDTAVALDGATGRITSGVLTASAFGVAGNADRTIECWARRDPTSTGYNTLWGYGDPGQPNCLYLGCSSSPASWEIGAWGGLSTFTLADDTDWRHIVLTYRGSTRQFQVFADGSLIHSYTHSADLTTGDTVFAIGYLPPSGGEYWKGSVDEVAVYANVLSDARIQAHYAAGVTGESHGGTADLVTTPVLSAVTATARSGAGASAATPILSTVVATTRFDDAPVALTATIGVAGAASETIAHSGILDAGATLAAAVETVRYATADQNLVVALDITSEIAEQIEASGSLTQSTVLTAAAASTRFGSATLALPVNTLAASVTARSATAAAAATADVAASGTSAEVITASGAVSASPVLTVETVSERFGAAVLTDTPDSIGSATTNRFGVGTLAVSGLLSASGETDRSTAAGIGATVAVTASGTSADVLVGSAALTITPTLNASATTVREVPAALNLVLGATATYDKVEEDAYSRKGSLNITPTLSVGAVNTTRLAMVAASEPSALTVTVTRTVSGSSGLALSPALVVTATSARTAPPTDPVTASPALLAAATTTRTVVATLVGVPFFDMAGASEENLVPVGNVYLAGAVNDTVSLTGRYHDRIALPGRYVSQVGLFGRIR